MFWVYDAGEPIQRKKCLQKGQEGQNLEVFYEKLNQNAVYVVHKTPK